MFQIGDCVAYGISGICQVIDICNSPFDAKDTRQFYVLKALYEKDRTIYTPVETGDVMGRVPFTKEMLTDLFSVIADIAPISVAEEKRRKDTYRGAMAKPVPMVCLQMLKTVAFRRANCVAQRKRLPAMDAEYENLAKKLLLQEIGYAFSVSHAEAENTLQGVLQQISTDAIHA